MLRCHYLADFHTSRVTERVCQTKCFNFNMFSATVIIRTSNPGYLDGDMGSFTISWTISGVSQPRYLLLAHTMAASPYLTTELFPVSVKTVCYIITTP